MRFRTWFEGVTFRGYGGPKFDWHQYVPEYKSNQYHTYKQLYDDVQLELSNMQADIKAAWKVPYTDLIWFEDVLNPKQYTSGMTVESCWEDDFKAGEKHFENLLEYLEHIDGPFDPEDLKNIDPSKMECVKRMMWDYDYENMRDDEYDLTWGPHDWNPGGEWGRCKQIKYDEQDYPVTVLVNGKMIDGAHRLAVAIFNRRSTYPCLVGVPQHWF